MNSEESLCLLSSSITARFLYSHLPHILFLPAPPSFLVYQWAAVALVSGRLRSLQELGMKRPNQLQVPSGFRLDLDVDNLAD
jgi:hypothetical protein